MNTRPLDTVPYAPGVTDAQLRFLGSVDSKRVLMLGVRDATAPRVFAQEGAHVVVVEPNRPRMQRADEALGGAGVEWHNVDYAELAFIRADTIDVAFSAGVVDEIDDFARVVRQVHRVLRPQGTFVFAYEHPLARCVDDGALARAWDDTTAVTVERDGESVTLTPRPPAAVVVALVRAGFRVDALAEPMGDDPRIPAAIVWRARKEGV